MTDESNDQGRDEPTSDDRKLADEPSAEPPRPAPEPARRLTRRPENKVIAGVCSGLGAYTGVDPVAWRIGFVVFTLISGIGLLAYIVAWLVMPMARRGDPVPPPRDGLSGEAAKWLGIGALILGSLLLFRNIWDFRGGLLWGLLLIGIGVALWGHELVPRSDRPHPAPPPPVPPPPPIPESTPTGPTTTTMRSIQTPPQTAVAAPAAPATEPAERREPSALGRIVVGAAALAIGGALLLDNLEVVRITPTGMIAVLLAIVGAGLLVGTWWGRARWLIIPGALLSIALVVSATMPFNVRGGFGQVRWAPASIEMIEPRYEHFAGEAVLDLAAVEFDQAPRRVEARVTFGELLVIVPAYLPTTATVRVQGGDVHAFGTRDQGWAISNRFTNQGRDGIGRLELNIEVMFGQVNVQTVAAAEPAPSEPEIAEEAAPNETTFASPVLVTSGAPR